MRIATLAIAGALSVTAPAAIAGPWARERGDRFLSFTVTAEQARAALDAGTMTTDPVFGAYGELGLGRRLTAGLDLSWATSSQMASVFLRRTLTLPDAPVQAAVHAGFGYLAVDGGGSDLLLRVGGSLGRGFGARHGDGGLLPIGRPSGWMVLDTAAYLDADGAVAIWQAEATLGLDFAPSARGILALKAEEWPDGDLLGTARPSIVYDFGGVALQAGAVVPIRGGDETGLFLSLWREF